MNKLIKISLVFVILCITAVMYVWFFVYNKPHTDYENAVADYILPAEVFSNDYANGTPESKKYLDKVLIIDGIPSSIEKTDSTVTIVFAYNSGMFGDEGIRCSIIKSHQKLAGNLNLTENISIKGHCTGYNDTDVILDQCSLISK